MKAQVPLIILLITLFALTFSCEEEPLEIQEKGLYACINEFEGEVEIGRPYQISSCSNDVVSYEWVVEGQNYKDTLVGKVVNYAFPEQGAFQIWLTVTDASGKSATSRIKTSASERPLIDISKSESDFYSGFQVIKSNDNNSFVIAGLVHRGGQDSRNFLLKTNNSLLKVLSNDFEKTNVYLTNICKAEFGYFIVSNEPMVTRGVVSKVDENGKLISSFDLPKAYWNDSFVKISAIKIEDGFLLLGKSKGSNSLIIYKFDNAGDLYSYKGFSLEGRSESEIQILSDFKPGVDNLSSVILLQDVTNDQLLKVNVSNSNLNAEAVVELGPALKNGSFQSFLTDGNNLLLGWSEYTGDYYHNYHLYKYENDVLAWVHTIDDVSPHGRFLVESLKDHYFLFGKNSQAVKLNSSGAVIWERNFNSDGKLLSVVKDESSIYLFGLSQKLSVGQQIAGLVLTEEDLQ